MANGKRHYMTYQEERIKSLLHDDRWADEYRARLRAAESSEKGDDIIGRRRTTVAKPARRSTGG